MRRSYRAENGGGKETDAGTGGERTEFPGRGRQTDRLTLPFRGTGLQRERMQLAAHLAFERFVDDLMLLHA